MKKDEEEAKYWWFDHLIHSQNVPLEQESLPEVAEEVVLFEIFTEEELVVLEVTKSCRHNGSEFNAYIGQ